MVPPAAAQRETGPWERKTDKTHSVRGAARPPGPSRGAPVHTPSCPWGKSHPRPVGWEDWGRGRGGSRLSARRRLRQIPREGTRRTPRSGFSVGPSSTPPSSPPRTHRTQIRTHRPERRGLTPRPPLPPPAEEVQPLPPAAMTPYLARSGGPGACDSSGSLRPHLHLTPRTRPSAGRPPARRRACTRGLGRASPRVGEGRRGRGKAPG